MRANIELPLAYHRSDLAARDVAERVRDLALELDFESHLETPSFRVNASVRKRALFARALVLAPRLLLCDEPQIGLTMREARKVSDALARRVSAGMTVVFADHDGLLDPYCVDRTLYVEHGHVLSRPSGRPPPDEDELERPSRYGATLFGGDA